MLLVLFGRSGNRAGGKKHKSSFTFIDFVNQETKRPLEDEKNSEKDKPALKIDEEGVFSTKSTGENMLHNKKDGIYIHCHPNGITGGIPENHQLKDMVCDSQDSVNRFKGQESQKAHSKGT